VSTAYESWSHTWPKCFKIELRIALDKTYSNSYEHGLYI
jgi:hypothetical protein